MPSKTPLTDILIGTGWGVAITLLLIGWGYLVLTKDLKKQPLWLLGSLGLGCFVITSIFLDYLQIATRTNLTYLLLFGALGYLKCISSKEEWTLDRWKPQGGEYAIIILGLFFAAIASNSWVLGANWDDTSGYWPVCHQMAASGTSDAPLSFRRSLSLGGQYGLQTLGMLYTNEMGGSIYDRGVGAILGILLGCSIYRRFPNKKTIGTGLGLLAVIVPQNALNSAPAVSLFFVLLAAYYLKANLRLLPILLATAILLRTQAVFPAFMIGLVALYDYAKVAGWKKSCAAAIKLGALVLLLLTPSALISYKLYETPLIYLYSGTVNEDYINFEGQLKYSFLNIPQFLAGCMLLLAACTYCVVSNLGRTLNIIALTTLLITYVTMPEYSSYEWLRYTWPLASAALVYAMFKLKENDTRTYGLLGICAILSTTPMTMVSSNLASAKMAYKNSISEDYICEPGIISQYSIPEGAGVIVINRTPTVLDYTRNKLIVWDSFPAVGDCPRNSNPEDWKNWAKSYGADYLMYENWELPGDYIPEYNAYITIEDMWTKYTSVTLPHYTRVWLPDRKKMVEHIKDLEKKVPHWVEGGSTILDLR